MILQKSEGIGEKDTFPFSFIGTSKGWQLWNKSHTAVMQTERTVNRIRQKVKCPLLPDLPPLPSSDLAVP
jgi:hypothetical protein